jgi:hypothetical protein
MLERGVARKTARRSIAMGTSARALAWIVLAP